MKKHTKAAFAFVLFVSFQTTAHADDGKIYSGTVCSASDGLDWSSIRYNAGYAYNYSSDSTPVNCSIERDSISKKLTYFEISGYNYSNSSNCSVSMINWNGTGAYGETEYRSGAGNWVIDFDNSAWSSWNRWTYFVECNLGSYARIYRLFQKEQ